MNRTVGDYGEFQGDFGQREKESECLWTANGCQQ